MSWEDKFRSSRQPDLKLQIALERLADPQELSEQWRQTYREYLSQRSYSALMWLIRQRNPSRIRKFLTWGIAGREECRRALEQSGTENPEIRLLLMGMDQERPEQAISREEEAARHAWELTGESLAFEIPYLHLFFTDFRFYISPAPADHKMFQGEETEGSVSAYNDPCPLWACGPSWKSAQKALGSVLRYQRLGA